MSFLAKIFISGEERMILDATQVYRKFSDPNGKASSSAFGSTLDFSIESTADDSFFYQKMFSPSTSFDGEIVFYRRDGISTLFRIEFANAYVTRLQEIFNATNNSPLHMRLSISWGIVRMKGVIHEEYWNPNNPFIEIEPTEINNLEPEIIRYHIEDIDNNTIDKEEINIGDEIYLVIESSNAIGKSFIINLEDRKLDYEHENRSLKNDKLTVNITDDIQRIHLKAIKQN